MFAIGIDIGGTNTKYGIATKEGEITFQSRVKTREYSDYKCLVSTIIEDILRHCSVDEIAGAGVGAPNGNFYNGSIEQPPNLPWPQITPFAEEVENVLGHGKKCALTNDANAAALGEMMYGRAKGMKYFLVLTLGTGVGSGIVTNGDLIYGKHGFAGELGHVVVKTDGRDCTCGKVGCLETYASATGIRRTIHKLLSDHLEPSLLRGVSFDDLSPRFITEAAEKGDFIAQQAFRYTGEILGQKISDFVVHTNPEAVFLMGGLARAGHWLVDPTRESFNRYLMPLFQNRGIQIYESGLKDDDAPILGASSLVWKYLV